MINEVISGNTPSATTTAVQAVTDIVVEGNGKGAIFLECMVPGGEWVVITHATGAYAIDTADTAIEYRFRPAAVETPVRVYMGP
jgi:hypothetical protein